MDSHDSISSIFGSDYIPSTNDAVDYRIYFYPRLENATSYNNRLQHILEWVNQNLIKDFLWQDEPFNLILVKGADSSSVEPAVEASHKDEGNDFHFFGSTRFGDNVDDEWFIVHILLEISRHFSDVFISVVDCDGEFLLIEAAEVLPSWVQPETALNRVWLHEGRIHLVPQSLLPSLGATRKEAIINAVQSISSNKIQTAASKEIEQSIQKRLLLCTDNRSQSNYHWAACILPFKAAYLLQQHPNWINQIVSAFYLRDPTKLAHCSRFPTVGHEPKVTSMVRFTRCLYAQVHSQQWKPPRNYGTASPDQVIQFELGAKLAFGIELLMQQESSRTKTLSASNIQRYNFEQDIDWKEYVQKLKSIGYFRCLPETSLNFIDLENKAKAKFLSLHPAKAESSLPPSISNEIEQTLAQLQGTTDPNTLFPKEKLFPSSPIDWLFVSPEEVDTMILHRLGSTPLNEGPDSHQKNQLLDALVSDVSQFLSTKSEIDGVSNIQPSKDNPGDQSWLDDVESIDSLDEEDLIDPDDLQFDFAMKTDESGMSRLAMLEMMQEMDAELLQTELAKSFERHRSHENENNSNEDIDARLTLVKNFIESYAAQNGAVGPTSTLISQLPPKPSKQK